MPNEKPIKLDDFQKMIDKVKITFLSTRCVEPDWLHVETKLEEQY